jgi:hypothetical protein
MRLAIMQPYFLPYVGYFQLMAAVDKFVLLDDVNFINRGWINRNRIVVNGKPYWLTLPLAKASQNRLINEIDIVDDPVWKRKMLRTVELTYQSAPFAHRVLPMFGELLEDAKGGLSTFLTHHLRRVAHYIGIDVSIEPTSRIYPKEGRTGQDRILDICAREKAMSYVNLPGGRDLYDPQAFAMAGIKLLFIEPNLDALVLQHGGQEGPSLSILDLLMHNSAETIGDAVRNVSLSSEV